MDVTNDDKNRLLTAVELKAVELKFYGFEYAEISQLLQEEFPEIYPSVGTLKNWFSRKGKLYDYYEEYNKEQTATNLKEATALWKGHSKNAMRSVLKIMQKGDSDTVKLAAAKEILGRAYGSIPAVVAQSHDDNLMKRILKKAGVIEDEPTENTKDS